MWKKIRFKFEISEKIYKGFPLKFFFPRESFVKWTQIKIKGNSFVNCLLEVLDQFKGNSFIFFKRTYFKKDFVVKKIYVILYKIKQKNLNGKKYKKEKKKRKLRNNRKERYRKERRKKRKKVRKERKIYKGFPHKKIFLWELLVK